MRVTPAWRGEATRSDGRVHTTLSSLSVDSSRARLLERPGDTALARSTCCCCNSTSSFCTLATTHTRQQAL
jgi:hypothetical protein